MKCPRCGNNWDVSKSPCSLCGLLVRLPDHLRSREHINTSPQGPLSWSGMVSSERGTDNPLLNTLPPGSGIHSKPEAREPNTNNSSLKYLPPRPTRSSSGVHS